MQIRENSKQNLEFTKQKVEKRKKNSIFSLVLIANFLLPFTANAQCAMCRAALESEGNTAKSEAVNDGIVYLMAFPYIIVGLIGFAIYRMYYKKK